MARFDGKVAVVTGAGQGLGAAVAKAFIDEGAKVIMIARTAAKLENVAAELGENAIVFPMDISVEADWHKLVQFIKDNFGEIDYLVNNAAVNKLKNIRVETIEEFVETVNTNLVGTYMGIKLCHEVIKKGCYSTIVNIGSIGGMRSGPANCHDPAYNATKAGIAMLTKHVAYEYGKDYIKCMTVIPAAMDSPMRSAYHAAHPDVAAASKASKPLPPHVAQPSELAAAVLFCCDPANISLTGSEILVDNGMMTH